MQGENLTEKSVSFSPKSKDWKPSPNYTICCVESAFVVLPEQSFSVG